VPAGVDGGVVPTSLSHKGLHEEVVEEVEDEGMDSAEDFPQGAHPSDEFFKATRSLPLSAGATQQGSSSSTAAQEEEGEGVASFPAAVPSKAAQVDVEAGAGSVASAASAGTKPSSSGPVVDEYSMSFDGGDLELEGEIDLGGDIEVDASPLTTPRGKLDWAT
jgi:hypothetical protein